jgi:hypothetical protein
MLTKAMHPEGHHKVTEEDVAIARVIGNVWPSASSTGSPVVGCEGRQA